MLKVGKFFIIVLGALYIVSGCMASSSDEKKSKLDEGQVKYQLVWSDEFDYEGLPDSTKWKFDTKGNDYGWGNNELQYYTSSPGNAFVSNGSLAIVAREELIEGKTYSSARISTKNKFDFRYGKIEARIKLPHGQGIWPAFWMLGANHGSIDWPACGEIDVMEMVGGPNSDNTTHCTLHWEEDGKHAKYGESHSLSTGILGDDFHVFYVEWDKYEVKGIIDSTQYFIADISKPQSSEFHENFYILLNLAVGGNWPGSPDDSTTWPQTMEVDYVRVYQQSYNK